MAGEIKFCSNCGKKLNPGVKFCRYCGTQIIRDDGVSSVKNSVTAAEPLVANTSDRVSALYRSGEFEVMNFNVGNSVDNADMTLSSEIDSQDSKVMSPLGTIWDGIKSILGGSFGLLIQPKMLIPVLVLAVLWIFLGMAQSSDQGMIKILSWLTFAQGGLDRSDTIGTVGGIFGKGAVGAMFLSLFNGGFPKLFSGISSIFKKTQGKMGFLPIIFGYIAGMVTNFAFVGFDTANAQSTMAGISGIVLSLQALGGKSGLIYSMAESFTAKKNNGIRIPQDGKIKSLLIGIAAGFGTITALSSLL